MAAKACLRLHLSKYHIVGNHVSRLILLNCLQRRWVPRLLCILHEDKHWYETVFPVRMKKILISKTIFFAHALWQKSVKKARNTKRTRILISMLSTRIVHINVSWFFTLDTCTCMVVYLISTFAAKHLKKPIPQCHACFKDSWILRVYGFNTEYLQNHSTFHCKTFTECC